MDKGADHRDKEWSSGLPKVWSEVLTAWIQLSEDLTVIVGLLGVWCVERVLLGRIGKLVIADQWLNVLLQVLKQGLLLVSYTVGEGLLWSPGKISMVKSSAEVVN